MKEGEDSIDALYQLTTHQHSSSKTAQSFSVRIENGIKWQGVNGWEGRDDK